MARCLLALIVCLAGMLGSTLAEAANLRIAVAANFRETLLALQPVFEATGEERLTISAGSTGQLFAQISNGAPYDVFLAADQDRPARLAEAGLAAPGSAFTYATGRLVLLAPGRPLPDAGATPSLDGLARIAIANPRTAPYGAAAEQVLDRLGAAGLQRVLAQNVAGVVSAVESGAAPAGLTAQALLGPDRQAEAWQVPADWHDPIRQDAVLLSRAQDPDAAARFLAWLGSDPEARQIIRSHGYVVD